ncbi:Nuclease harbi1 [Camponotus japonicus]
MAEKRELSKICASFLCLEAAFSSSSSSSSEDEEDNHSTLDFGLAFVMVKTTPGEIVQISKISDYVERIVPEYSKNIFREHFRIYPETFEVLLHIIGSSLMETPVKSGRKPIPAKKQLLIALWYLATPDSYRSVCVKFGVGKVTAHRALRRVTRELHRNAFRFI